MSRVHSRMHPAQLYALLSSISGVLHSLLGRPFESWARVRFSVARSLRGSAHVFYIALLPYAPVQYAALTVILEIPYIRGEIILRKGE